MKKRKFLLIILITFIIVSLGTKVFGYVEFTDKELMEAFHKSIEDNSAISKIDFIEDEGQKKIRIYDKEEKMYEIAYEMDLDNKQIKLSNIINIEEGMQYDEFQNQIGAIVYTMIAYDGIAITQGCDARDGMYHVFDAILNDSNNKTSGITNDMLQSEFEKYYMQYIKENFGDNWNYSDKENTYSWNVYINGETAKSCGLNNEMIINLEGDFEAVKNAENLMEQLEKKMREWEKGLLEWANSTNFEEEPLNEEAIPQTGVGYGLKDIVQVMIIAIGAILIGMIVYDIKRK